MKSLAALCCLYLVEDIPQKYRGWGGLKSEKNNTMLHGPQTGGHVTYSQTFYKIQCNFAIFVSPSWHIPHEKVKHLSSNIIYFFIYWGFNHHKFKMIVSWYGSIFPPRSVILDRHISGSLSPLRGAESTHVQYAGRASRSDRVVTAPTETQ